MKTRLYILFPLAVGAFLFLSIGAALSQVAAPYEKVFPDVNYLRKPISRILFLRSEYSKSGREINSLWIAERNGSDQRFISYCSTGMALLPVAPPTLSPDKKKIAFCWLGNAPKEDLIEPSEKGLWVFDLQTGGKSLVYPEAVRRVRWSSDGKYLFFSRGREGIFRADVTSRETTKVISFTEGEIISDYPGSRAIASGAINLEDVRGERILFSRDLFDLVTESSQKGSSGTLEIKQKGIPRPHIWVWHTREREVRLLSEGSEAIFSPDGGKISLSRSIQTGDGRRAKEIWLMNSDGTGEFRLGRGAFPSFSPDGKWLIFFDVGSYENPSGWLNLLVTNTAHGKTEKVEMAQGWKEAVGRSVPSFEKIFSRYGYFQEPPRLIWFPSGEKVVYSIGYSFIFLADLTTGTSLPLFHWGIQVEPVLECVDETRKTILITSSMTDTPRRKKHPLRSSGWLREKDIWEVSLDGKSKKLLIENGFSPLLTEIR